jgi:hypothetical protein
VGEPALVFTEYRDTLLHVRDIVAPHATVIHGGLSRAERRASLARFAKGGILLSTDAAGEGLNLQHNCRVVINLELPWNPMRLEQRIGRVDRIGQQRRVHVFHLIAAATSEVRILEQLVSRVARAQADIGAPDPLGSTNVESAVATPSLVFHRLDVEAKTEYERLTSARRMDGGATVRPAAFGLHELHPLVVFSRRCGIRSQLGLRILVVLRSCLSDDTGRVAASHLTSVLIPASYAVRRSLGQLDALGHAITADANYADWLESTLAVHGAFWKSRLGREVAIAGVLDQTDGDELQPGLFDMRAEQARTVDAEHQRDVLVEATRHTTAAIRASSLTVRPPDLVLILVP